MKIHTSLCSKCGEPAYGTLEIIHGCACIGEPDDDGVTDYTGYTDVWWDDQKTVLQFPDRDPGPDNLPLVCCRNGHTWPTQIEW